MPKSEAFLMDCMEYMRSLPYKAFDLCVCDPPYGIGQGKDKNKTRSKMAVSKDYHSFIDEKPPKEYFVELMRVSRNQIIWGGQYFTDNLYPTPCLLVWDKNNGETDFADCEIAWTSFKSATRKFTYTWHGMLQGDMKNKEYRVHPTQKPVALYRWIFSKYAKQGDRILDTHLGSGSSRIAAYDAGLDFVGCEIDEVYFKAQEERFKAHSAQMNLFIDNIEKGQ